MFVDLKCSKNNAKKTSKAKRLNAVIRTSLLALIFTNFFKAIGIAAPIQKIKKGNTKSTQVIPGKLGLNL